MTLDDQRFSKTAAVARLEDQALTGLESLPGVKAAATVSNLPFEPGADMNFAIQENPSGGDPSGSTEWRAITPHYLQVMRIPVLASWIGAHVRAFLRARGHGHSITINEHRPHSHQAHLEWTPSRMFHWAQSIGPHTARLFERILADKPHPEMGYRSCLGLIRLAGQYSSARMEAAAERALATGACRYQSVKSASDPERKSVQ
jgi:hypothetical protein